jgi:phenylacetate-coenzyme A ligase PaaK-like adenylate-forming protein
MKKPPKNAALRLFFHRNIYDLPPTDDLFVAAMKQSVLYHVANCPDYAKIVDAANFDIDSVQTVDDLYKIPVLPTLFLKRHPLLSVPMEKLWFRSYTSGTSGKTSIAGLNASSFLRAAPMVLRVLAKGKIISVRPVSYIVLSFEPTERNKMGAVKTANAMTHTSPALRRTFALKDDGDKYVLNIDGIIAELVRCNVRHIPVRFMGFPGYFNMLLDELETRGITLQLNKKSLVMLAGGWKQFISEKLSKEALYQRTQRILGINEGQQREFFGAVEHPIVYSHCTSHRFHVPIYARVIIRDPVTLEPLPMGQVGIINLLTPLLTTMPYHSIMTDDLGILHEGTCPCGAASPWLEIIGRVGMADIKTCVAEAKEAVAMVGGL